MCATVNARVTWQFTEIADPDVTPKLLQSLLVRFPDKGFLILQNLLLNFACSHSSASTVYPKSLKPETPNLQARGDLLIPRYSLDITDLTGCSTYIPTYPLNPKPSKRPKR